MVAAPTKTEMFERLVIPVLLVINNSKLNTTRLHCILCKLSYHAPTRDWVLMCLLSILEKVTPLTNESTTLALDTSTPTPTGQDEEVSQCQD